VHGLAQRVVHATPDTPDVLAWGDPPVILRCGVARPKDLHAGSGAEFFALGPPDGPFWDVTSSNEGEVYTTVDRPVYISVSVPARYASGPMPALSRAIAKALPAVCSTNSTDPVKTLCTRRP
jgi:hypothetical protein